MRIVSCSRCHRTGWDELIGSKCPDCNGSGYFPHWNEGQCKEELKVKLEQTRDLLEASKGVLMDYVSGGQYADDIIDRRLKLEKMRWERDYWAFRVQNIQGELELMKGVGGGGQSVATEHSGIAQRQDTPSGTGPGTGSLHKGWLDDGDRRPAKGLDYRIP